MISLCRILISIGWERVVEGTIVEGEIENRPSLLGGHLINRYVGISPRFENPLEGGPTLTGFS